MDTGLGIGKGGRMNGRFVWFSWGGEGEKMSEMCCMFVRAIEVGHKN